MARAVTDPPEGGGPGWKQCSPGDLALYLGMAALLAVRLVVAARSTLWEGSDVFCYVNLGLNLAAGRGFVADYVLWHFAPYPSVYGRPEDFIAPGLSLMMVPFIWLLGRSYLAYTLPGILSHAVGLPLVMRALALRQTGSRPVALAAAWIVLLTPRLYECSQQPLTEVPFALLALLSLHLFTLSDERRWAAPMSGLALAAAALVRPQGQLLALLVPLANALRRKSWRGLCDRTVVVFVVCFLAGQAPWIVRNHLVHAAGSPMYARQAGFLGRSDVVEGAWYRFWWDSPTPTLADRYRSGAAGAPWRHVAEFIARGLAYTVGVGLFYAPRPLPAVILALPALAGILACRRRWETWLAVMVALASVVSVAILFHPRDRYFLVGYAFVVIYAMAGLEIIARRWLPGLMARILVPLVALSLGGWGLVVGQGAATAHPLEPDPQTAQAIAVYHELAERLPEDAVLLVEGDRYPARATYFTGRAAVKSPRDATPEQLRRLIDTYGIGYAMAPLHKPLGALVEQLGWREWFRRGAWVVYTAGDPTP